MQKAATIKAKLREKIKNKPKGFLEAFKEKYKVDDLYNCIHTFVLMGWDNKVAEYIANVKEYQAIYNAQNPTAQVDGLFLALTEPYHGENTDIVGREPLDLAIYENNSAVIKLLLANANISNRPFKTKTGIIEAPIVFAICTAIKSFEQNSSQTPDFLPMVDALLDYQADPNTIDVSYRKPILGLCVSSNFLAGAERLIAKGARLFEITEGELKGETLFSVAIQLTKFPMIRLLAKKFAQQIKNEIDQCREDEKKIKSNTLVTNDIKKISGPINVDELKVLQAKSSMGKKYSYMMLLVKHLSLEELLEIFGILQIEVKQYPSSLFWSVACNRTDIMSYLLKQGIDPYFTMPANSGVDGYNLLMAASLSSAIPPLITLIKDYKDLIYQRAPIGEFQGSVALDVMIKQNQLLVMQYLAKQPYELSYLHSLSDDDSVLGTAVVNVAFNKDLNKVSVIFDLIQSLAKRPENAGKINAIYACALHYAMIFVLEDVFEKLLPFVTNVNITYRSCGMTYRLIQPAILSNKLMYIEKLVQKGLALEFFIGLRKVPLVMVLVKRKRHDILKFFLDKNIDVKSIDPQTNLYPLELAFLIADIESALLLLQYGAELDKEYQKLNGSPLTYLVVNDYSQHIKALLERGADPYYVNKEGDYAGKSPLQIVLDNSDDNPEMLVPFLENARVNKEIIKEFTQGSSIVYAAVKYNDQSLLDDLLKNGVKLNQPNREGIHSGDLPLALAIRNKDKPLIQKLLAAGATADAELCLANQSPMSCRDLAIQLAYTDILAMLNIQMPVPQITEVQSRQLEASDAATTIFIADTAELAQINPEVYYSHIFDDKKCSVFLHHATWEIEQLSEHLAKIRLYNTEFKKRKLLYLIAVDLLRTFEALMQYSIAERNESIITVKLASEIRNIVMHVFFKLDIEYLVPFAKMCVDQILPVIGRYMQGLAGSNIDLNELLKESELYIKLQPLLQSNAERTLNHDDLVKLIVDSLQFLKTNMEYIDDKIAFRAAPRTVRISCMALTIIGQYHRLLQESNADIEELFKRHFTDKSELKGFLSFLNRCTYLRGMVGHEFNESILKVNNMLAVDTIGELSLFKMLLSVKRYYRNFELGKKKILNSDVVNLAHRI